eukprot:5740936-Alexandrium_andersonii.AAC.1
MPAAGAPAGLPKPGEERIRGPRAELRIARACVPSPWHSIAVVAQRPLPKRPEGSPGAERT